MVSIIWGAAKGRLMAAGLAIMVAAAAPGMAAPAYKVLVFSKTVGYRHDSIPSGLAAIQQLGVLNNFGVTATDDANAFTDANLAQFAAVIFLSTVGDVLNTTQQAAFERYIRAGHGFAGIHSACDTEYAWPWYGGLIGAWYISHPDLQTATVLTEDSQHNSTRFLPEGWKRYDEWYNFRTNPRLNVQVLCRLDETSYTGGTMGDHPIAWCHAYDGGRAWYTGGGHLPETFSEPLFLRHLLGGIQYAAGVDQLPAGARWLFDGTSVASWRGPNGQPVPWLLTNGFLQIVSGSGNIQTFQQFQDFRLHLEFMLPSSGSGNSGVFLQDQFEIQILNSYGVAQPGTGDCGAIWSVRSPDKNASLAPGVWQSFDIEFHAALWQGSAKISSARVSVRWNDQPIHTDVAIPRSTAGGTTEQPGPGPIKLQDYGDPVQFRNIWIQPLTPVPQGTTVAIVPPGSTWRYLDTGANLGTAWRAPNFAEQNWSTGRAQLGYGDDDEATVIKKTDQAGSQIITTYFRKLFVVQDFWSLTNLNLLLLRDDGAIVYLNGVEVFRSNMPAGIVSASTPASTSIGGGLETTWVTTTLTTNALVEGENLLAVELHQTSSTTDASFDLALYAEKYELPQLRTVHNNGKVTLTWPALPSGFRLESTPDLTADQSWEPGTIPPQVVPTVEASVTVTNPIGTRFYHLRRD